MVGERPPLFLDESDDEKQDVPSASKPSFFAEEDEDMVMVDTGPNLSLKRPLEEEDSDFEVVEAVPLSEWRSRSPPQPPTPSRGSVPQSPIDVDDDDDIVIVPPPPAKRRRLSPSEGDIVGQLSLGAKDKGKEPADSSKPISMYLGELVLDDAWATCSGKGLTYAGDSLVIHRDTRTSDRGRGSSSKPSAKSMTKKHAGKQMKLTSMFKEAPKPVKTTKRDADDYIVRLSNKKGQELGRLPNRIASWVSNLLDHGVIKVVGSVIDCPTPLRTGCHIIVSLRFYFLATAFSSPATPETTKRNDLHWLAEGTETQQEKLISNRKASLLQLFKLLSLQPTSKKKNIDPDAIAFSKEHQAMSMHPLWEEYEFPIEPSDGIIDLCEDEDKFFFNPYSGELSLAFPAAERSCRGGILADEMGMGKTIQISALIHTNSQPEDSDPENVKKPSKAKQATLGFKNKPSTSTSKGSSSGPAATLIVAPLSLLAQWKAELERSSKDECLKIFIYHGTSRGDVERLVDPTGDDPVNVVIISYGTLASEHTKTLRGGESPLYEVEWLRVVLDEAHFIKSRHTKTAKSCYALRARRRWCLTGTPIVNRLEDLHSLLHFLKDEPWADFAFFKSCITTPFLNQDPKCLQVVQVVLESILLRREKTMKDKNGNPIVALPPKEVTTEKLEFSPVERKIYDSIYQDVKTAYNAFSEGGSVLKRMEELENEECPLCLDKMQDPVLIPDCHHSGCKECIVEHLQNQEEKGQEGFCPVCQRKPVDERSLIEVVFRPSDRGGQPSAVLRKNDFLSSTKLDALKQHLTRLRQKDPTFKAIVFSQFTGFLDLIEATLQREGFAHYRLDGQMPQPKRTRVLKEFAEPSDEPKIFAISLKAGGVGLNLTSANYVFMMDCWWNSAVESQAIDRIHRIGQEKTVYVTHFIISNTIEERIVAIQKRKMAIVKGALGGGKADKEAFENLKIMFEEPA
ncbi:DNA helicase rad5 [Tulasnella sp. 419]|nr:DNA helicase rad5 [Tulasnella sp. 419]